MKDRRRADVLATIYIELPLDDEAYRSQAELIEQAAESFRTSGDLRDLPYKRKR